MSTNILGRLEAFLSQVSASDEERIKIQQNLLNYIEEISTNFGISQITSPRVKSVITNPSSKLNLIPANYSQNLPHSSKNSTPNSTLLSSFSHQKLALHTAFTQISPSFETNDQIKQIQEVISSYELKTSKNTSQLQSPDIFDQSNKPLLPELCSLYDLHHDDSTLVKIGQKNGKNTADGFNYQRTNNTMAVSSLNKNIVWYLTSTAVIGIDLASLIESEQTSCFRAGISIPLSHQQSQIDLSVYNNIVVNSTSTLAVLYSTTTNLPTSITNLTNSDSISLHNDDDIISDLCFNPLPIVIELPALETHHISLFYPNNDQNEQHKHGQTMNKFNQIDATQSIQDRLPVSRVKVSFLITEQIAILKKMFKKQQEIFNLEQNPTLNSLEKLQKIEKLKLTLLTLSKLYKNAGMITDLQFHALSPTTVIILTGSTLGMYTVVNTFLQTHFIPGQFLPKLVQNESLMTSQQATMPTVFYDLNILPYVLTDNSLKDEFGSQMGPNGDKSNRSNNQYNQQYNQQNNQYNQQNDSNLSQTWIKLVYIPLPTITPTTPQKNQIDQSESSISFTYAILSSSGLMALISPLIPHMFMCPTDKILQLRSHIISKAFPNLSTQLRQHYAEIVYGGDKNGTDKGSNSGEQIELYEKLRNSDHSATQARNSRWLTLLAYIDQVFGLVPKSPFMNDKDILDFFIVYKSEQNDINNIVRSDKSDKNHKNDSNDTNEKSPKKKGIFFEGLSDFDIITLCTIDLPNGDYLISDLLYSDCLTQIPVLQLCGYVHSKLYQRLPNNSQNNLMQESEYFIDCTLLLSDIPILASVSVINNHLHRLPTLQYDQTIPNCPASQNSAQKTHDYDHGQSQSALIRVNTHYSLLSTSLQSNYSQKINLFDGFIFSPTHFFNEIQKNYHFYVQKYRNSILSTKRRDVPIGNIESRDSFTQRVVRLSTPYIYDNNAKITQVVISEQNNNHHNNNHHNNTLDNSALLSSQPTGMISSYISNRPFSLGGVALQLTHNVQTVTGSLPVLTQSGFLSQFSLYSETSQLIYIDTSFSYIHLPQSMFKLSTFKYAIQQSVHAAVLYSYQLQGQCKSENKIEVKKDTKSDFGNQSFNQNNTLNGSLMNVSKANDKPRRRKLGMKFIIESDGEDDNNKDNEENNEKNQISALKTNAFSSQNIPKNSDLSTEKSPQDAQIDKILPFFSILPTVDTLNDPKSIFAQVTPSMISDLGLGASKIDIINELILDLIITLRQKQLQNAFIGLQLSPIEHYLYPTITQSYLPGLQLQPLPQYAPDLNDQTVQLTPQGTPQGTPSIGIKHTSLSITTSVQTHSMGYYFNPQTLSLSMKRIIKKYKLPKDCFICAEQPQLLRLIINSLMFLFHGVTDSSVFSNVLSYYNTIDNNKLAAIQRLILTRDSPNLSPTSSFETALHSTVNAAKIHNRINTGGNFDVERCTNQNASTPISVQSKMTNYMNQSSVSYVDTIATTQPFSSIAMAGFSNNSKDLFPQNNPQSTFVPISPYHLPLTLLYSYASLIPLSATGSSIVDNNNNNNIIQHKKLFQNYLTTSLISQINNSGGQTSSIPLTLSLSSMYLGIIDVDEGGFGDLHNDSNLQNSITQSNPFKIQYDNSSKYYQPSQTASQKSGTIGFNHDQNNNFNQFNSLAGQFRPAKLFTIFATMQIRPILAPQHFVKNSAKNTPPQVNNNTAISQFCFYPLPLPQPIYEMYTDILEPKSTNITTTSPATSLGSNAPSILTHPSTVAFMNTHPQHDLNTPLDSQLDELKETYCDIIDIFSSFEKDIILPSTIDTAQFRQQLQSSDTQSNNAAKSGGNSPSHRGDIGKNEQNLMNTPIVSSITEFISRYSSSLQELTPVQSLGVRIDQESAKCNHNIVAGKIDPKIDPKKSGITISTNDQEFIQEISDRILVIKRDCYEAKLHISVSINILTELTGSVNDFVNYLLDFFIILESNLDFMVEKYNLLATKQEFLQTKLKLLNEKVGAIIISQKNPTSTENGEIYELLHDIDDNDDNDNNDIKGDIKLVPKMNKNPAQIYQQLNLLNSKIAQMTTEMDNFKSQQDDLMIKQRQMFGIGIKVEPSGENTVIDTTGIKQEFSSVFEEIVGVYHTLLSYRVRIQAAQNELQS